jgi:hypothetical protein
MHGTIWSVLRGLCGASCGHYFYNCSGAFRSTSFSIGVHIILLWKFSGDMLFDTDQRKLLKDYIDRWNRAITDHESNMKKYGEADRDQER